MYYVKMVHFYATEEKKEENKTTISDILTNYRKKG
jgi:hypothetical protein